MVVLVRPSAARSAVIKDTPKVKVCLKGREVSLPDEAAKAKSKKLDIHAVLVATPQHEELPEAVFTAIRKRLQREEALQFSFPEFKRLVFSYKQNDDAPWRFAAQFTIQAQKLLRDGLSSIEIHGPGCANELRKLWLKDAQATVQELVDMVDVIAVRSVLWPKMSCDVYCKGLFLAVQAKVLDEGIIATATGSELVRLYVAFSSKTGGSVSHYKSLLASIIDELGESSPKLALCTDSERLQFQALVAKEKERELQEEAKAKALEKKKEEEDAKRAREQQKEEEAVAFQIVRDAPKVVQHPPKLVEATAVTVDAVIKKESTKRRTCSLFSWLFS